MNEANAKQLSDDDDMVRYELRSALAARGIMVIPTLVESASLPNRERMPDDLSGLLEWNAFALTDEGWEDDVRLFPCA